MPRGQGGSQHGKPNRILYYISMLSSEEGAGCGRQQEEGERGGGGKGASIATSPPTRLQPPPGSSPPHTKQAHKGTHGPRVRGHKSTTLLLLATCVAIAAVAAYGDAGAGVQRSGAGLQASCNVTADAPDVARWGDDVLSSPLSPGSTLAACQALCCASTTCVAYSFNSPQPNDTCVGGSCCTVGDVCCMLKGSPGGTLRKNPYPGVVQTGTVGHAAGPGPSPPFPPSTTITGLTW